MADNVGIITGTGATIATDQNSSAPNEHYQIIKVAYGSRDTNVFTVVDPTHGLPVSIPPYPVGAVPITAASGNVANAEAKATLSGASEKTTYITGFEITSTGATVGAVVTPTITGVVTGTLTYVYAAPAGVLAMGTPLIVSFGYPIPASATNTAISVILPALGSGNTNACTVAHGFRY